MSAARHAFAPAPAPTLPVARHGTGKIVRAVLRVTRTAVACVMPTALGCAHPPATPFTGLSVDISNLELHLRDDPYQSFAHLGPDGRNVFEVTRWKLERLQRERAADPEAWTTEDFVIEFARARTLERLHFYRLAAEAYRRVARSKTRMAEPAAATASTMERFATLSDPIDTDRSEEEILAEIDARITAWRAVTMSEREPSYASLAREELESWQVLRVVLVARTRGGAEAIRACEQLVAENRASKLYPKHLLQLADLHAERARDIVAWARAQQQPLHATRYETHLEAALAAYELASEARIPVFRREAQLRMQALLAHHDGVLDGVY